MHVMQCFTQFGNGGYEMKKIFIILCCFGILSAHATEMCARDDTVVIPLDATIVAKGGASNGVEFVWWNNFDYGTIYGGAACLSKKEVEEMGSWPISSQNIKTLNTASDELIGSTGYYMNADVNPDIPDAEKPDYERRYCNVKLTHPMSSNWVYTYDYVTAPSCQFGCITNISAGWTGGVQNIKTALFNSIGTTPPWPLE